MKYNIVGENMQTLNVDLQGNDKIYADAGKLVSKTQTVKMVPRMRGGIVGAIVRDAEGASAFLTEYQSTSGVGTVALAGSLPGKIVPITLVEGQTFIAEHAAFIAAEDSVKLTLQLVKISAAMFGGAGFILQKFEGPGTVFIHIIGNVVEYNIDEDNPLEIDPGHIAGFDSNLKYEITFVDNIRSMMFGGMGVFLAKFEGKGRVLAHAVSRYKLALELYQLGIQQDKGKK
jgi:uncharacterized protein (TIGR00266 family)